MRPDPGQTGFQQSFLQTFAGTQPDNCDQSAVTVYCFFLDFDLAIQRNIEEKSPRDFARRLFPLRGVNAVKTNFYLFASCRLFHDYGVAVRDGNDTPKPRMAGRNREQKEEQGKGKFNHVC